MVTIPKISLPHEARPTVSLPDGRDAAQSLRPTFDGWGPRL